MINLHEQLLNFLNARFPKKADLCNLVSDYLRVERESVYRRLRGNVAFTVQELGILSQKMGFSIDSLLYRGANTKNSLVVNMIFPRTMHSITELNDTLKASANMLDRIATQKGVELGAVACIIPVEFFILYPNLTKFLYFKWGYHHVDDDQFRNYDAWEMPESIRQWSLAVRAAYDNFDDLFYIWDDAVIWSTINELNYFTDVHIISSEAAQVIREDLHAMLRSMERDSQVGANSLGKTFNLYTSNVNMGISCSYARSSTGLCHTFLNSTFFNTTMSDNQEVCTNICNWIKSMKKVATLISGSGEKERILFFEKQHAMVDHR